MKTAEFGRGIKAGVAGAGVYLVIALILGAIGQTFCFRSDFVSAAGLAIQLGFADPFVLASSIWTYVFRGIVFGAILAALYHFLPGATSITKGVVLSGLLWILGAVEVIYMTLGWPPGAGQTSWVAGLLPVSLSRIGLTLVSIVSALAFGALAGAIWNKLRAKEVAELRNGAPALLVGLIMGGLGWAAETVGLSLSVVIGGIPILQILERVGPFWWPNMLYVSVVFVGLPGWILTFIAWRKTRRGESGFKWGVVGGGLMVLTGIMLLPGVLAIIGAALNRHKPTVESSSAGIGQ
jgi:hypothetical protein